MSGPFGFRCVNDNGVLNVSDESQAFTYLGKYGPFGGNGVASYTVDITCGGFPLVFFTVPYNFTIGDGSEYRSGVFVESIKSIGTNRWRVTMGGQNASTTTNNLTSLQTTLRVFGRLDLNPGSVSGPPWGIRVFNSGGACVFDSRAPMFRLAGNTYDTEVLLDARCPGYNGQAFSSTRDAYDTYMQLPFSMANKSICAGTRGIVAGYNFVANYTDVDNQQVYQYRTNLYGSGYWATGNTLVARKLIVGSDSFERNTGIAFSNETNLNNVYTRLAVIDNNLFP